MGGANALLEAGNRANANRPGGSRFLRRGAATDASHSVNRRLAHKSCNHCVDPFRFGEIIFTSLLISSRLLYVNAQVHFPNPQSSRCKRLLKQVHICHCKKIRFHPMGERTNPGKTLPEQHPQYEKISCLRIWDTCAYPHHSGMRRNRTSRTRTTLSFLMATARPISFWA